MSLLNLEQGTAEWLAWRLQGLGGSDMPAVMGISPYGTCRELWEVKAGFKVADDWKDRGAYAKGHEMEQEVRAAYEFIQEASYPPVLMENDERPWMRASLDGWNDERQRGCEIKFVSREVYENGIIRPDHMVQVQWQMLVTRTAEWDYVMKGPDAGKPIKIVTVLADKEMQIGLLNQGSWFWSLVQSKTPPPYEDRDWVPVDDKDLALTLGMVKQYKDSKKKADVQVLDGYRKTVFSMVKNARTLCAGAKITKTEKIQRIEFLKEDKGEDRALGQGA